MYVFSLVPGVTCREERDLKALTSSYKCTGAVGSDDACSDSSDRAAKGRTHTGAGSSAGRYKESDAQGSVCGGSGDGGGRPTGRTVTAECSSDSGMHASGSGTRELTAGICTDSEPAFHSDLHTHQCSLRLPENTFLLKRNLELPPLTEAKSGTFRNVH